MWVRMCGETEVGEDAVVPVDVAGKRLMVCRISGRVSVADRTCTHADADLSCGFVSPEGVRCPLHLSVFDAATGAPLNPPATEPLPVFNVKIESGVVYAEV